MVATNPRVPGIARKLAVEAFLRDDGDPDKVVVAKVTVVKRIALASDPKASRLPKFDCGEGKRRSIFLGLDDPRILKLGDFLEKREIRFKGGKFENARPELRKLLKEFNEQINRRRNVGPAELNESTVTLDVAPSPCSMPGHTWTGTGCRPASGGGGGIVAMTVQIDDGEPTTQFGKVHNEFAAFAFGYCLSVLPKQFDPLLP